VRECCRCLNPSLYVDLSLDRYGRSKQTFTLCFSWHGYVNKCLHEVTDIIPAYSFYTPIDVMRLLEFHNLWFPRLFSVSFHCVCEKSHPLSRVRSLRLACLLFLRQLLLITWADCVRIMPRITLSTWGCAVTHGRGTDEAERVHCSEHVRLRSDAWQGDWWIGKGTDNPLF
jgi:hypothetical protein